MTDAELIDEIVDELTIELRNEPTFDADVLRLKVKDAYRKVRGRKCYENTSKSEEDIINDLAAKHFQDIKDVAMYNFNMIGAEGEVSHSENGTSRTFRTEDEVLGNICAYVGFFA